MIKLSKKWDYWLKSIIYLANRHWSLVKISDISRELSISETFLRRIIADFEKNSMLDTVKGRNGWVILKKELSSISLYDIFFSLWEDLNVSNCSTWNFCEKSKSCITTDIFKNLQKSFSWILKLYTLDKIIK